MNMSNVHMLPWCGFELGRNSVAITIITYHHGYAKKNNGIYHAIKSHECPGQR